MNALADTFSDPAAHTAIDTAVVLLGVGGVGSALLELLPAYTGLRLVGIANSSRQVSAPCGLNVPRLRHQLAHSPQRRDNTPLLTALRASRARRRVLVDASACAQLAEQHAAWLDAGFDVVSANKLAIGGALELWDRVHAAQTRAGTRYGDAATVGAGLPILSTLRRLRACGDRVLSLEGVFSGSLSWLLNRFDGSRRFSVLLDEACSSGLTEPDPRCDLGGNDVARKLAILARSVGVPLQLDAIEIENLLPPALRDCSLAEFRRRRDEFDAEIDARWRAAASTGQVLRHLACFDASYGAQVGLRAVDLNHPAAQLGGCDNLFAVTTTRYRQRPLLIQGAGAGPEVTAQALLGDLLLSARG